MNIFDQLLVEKTVNSASVPDRRLIVETRLLDDGTKIRFSTSDPTTNATKIADEIAGFCFANELALGSYGQPVYPTIWIKDRRIK